MAKIGRVLVIILMIGAVVLTCKGILDRQYWVIGMGVSGFLMLLCLWYDKLTLMVILLAVFIMCCLSVASTY